MAGRSRDQIYREMDAQLLNWARWACGPLVPITRGELRDAPIIAEAERVEAALLIMKHRRPQPYRATMLRYRNRWMPETCAQAMKTDERQFRRWLNQGYEWLDGRLSDRAA